MARRRNAERGTEVEVVDYRHDNTRKNIPPAKIAAEGRVPVVPKLHYSYSPRLDPVLRFDGDGTSDCLPELLETARRRALTNEEASVLAEALRTYEPWLEWAGKRESKGFEVDPVALHIHERVSAQAILKVAARKDITRDLFADPQQEYRHAVQFYQHDIDWANRLILGDSLQVMVSLAQREDHAGKVQMIYIDPPYGIRFGSNFQPTTKKEEVKDRDSDLTREPEMVRAYRDTWHLGVHSYLSYLRARLTACRALLADSGAIFVQIGEENLHRVRAVIDDVFGSENFIATILIKKKGGQKGALLEGVNDYILFAARNRDAFAPRYNKLYEPLEIDEDLVSTFRLVELPTGETLSIVQLAARLPEDHPGRRDPVLLLKEFPGARLFKSENTTAGGFRRNQSVLLDYNGRIFDPGLEQGNCWKHTAIAETGQRSGMRRVADSGRLYIGDKQIGFRRYHDDFGRRELTSWWDGLGGAPDPIYVVQTNPRVVERCMLMCTRPGDLVLDPTCGSGTTAYVAEQWGRRWITIDTSRVAVALARQRLLTAQFPYYEIEDEDRGVGGGLKYKTAPRITSGVVANCDALEPLIDKHQKELDQKLEKANRALRAVSSALRQKLVTKFVQIQKELGKRYITEGDILKLRLPREGESFEHWTVPFEPDPEYPKALQDAVCEYRLAWRAKRDEVNALIARFAEPTTLVNEPITRPKIVRVSGPFTVEAVQPPDVSLGDVIETSTGSEPEDIQDTFVAGALGMATADGETQVKNTETYFDQLIRLLKIDGVRFPDNKQMIFTRLEFVGGRSNAIHAEGRWTPQGEADTDAEGPARVAAAFGPQYGPVTAQQVEQLIRAAARHGYDDLVIAGFNFDGPAQAAIEEAVNPNVRVHMAHIRPDVNPGMAGLLKEQPGAQLFTVFGQPRTTLHGHENGEYVVIMEGVDIYNPVDNTVTPSRADKVAAWFLDSDYDGRTFCITQAFFPAKTAWAKLARALGTAVDPYAFEKLSGTESMPFPAGKHRTVAVKVIDPRGNEVMCVHRLED